MRFHGVTSLMMALALALMIFPAAVADDLPVGSPTPAFTLPTTDGGEVALRNEYGQPIVLIFADLSQDHSQRAIEEIGEVVAEGEFGDEVKVWVIVESAEGGSADFPTLVDIERATFADHGVVSVLPCVLFLDEGGLLHLTRTGHGIGFADTVQDELEFLTGQITEAELTLRRRGPAEADPNRERHDRRTNLANQMRRRGIIDQAQAEYEAVLAEAPDHTGALLGLAQIALGGGDAAAAETHVRTALEVNPDLPLGLKILARTRLLQDDPDGAAEALGRFVDIAGQDVETHYLQGRLEQTRGNHDGAATHFREACEDLLADRGWGLFTQE